MIIHRVQRFSPDLLCGRGEGRRKGVVRGRSPQIVPRLVGDGQGPGVSIENSKDMIGQRMKNLANAKDDNTTATHE